MDFETLYRQAKDYFADRDYSGFGGGVYAYEFDITGEGAGKFYLEVRDGAAELQPYDYKGSTCTFVMQSRHLLQMIDRTLSPVAAYTGGRLRIRGDVSAAFRLADALALPL